MFTLLLLLTHSAAALDLHEALAAAMSNNPQVTLAEARTAEARAMVMQGHAALLPQVQANGTWLAWDAPSDITFIDPATLDLSDIPEAFQDMLDGLLTQLGAPLRVREDTTRQLSVTVTQPITPLPALLAADKAARRGADAARASEDMVAADLTYTVTETWYRLGQARAFAEVAAEAVGTLEKLKAKATHFQEAGLAQRADVLTVEVALAEARERKIRAEAAVSLATANLARLMGKDQVEGVEVALGRAPAFDRDLESCLTAAQDRPVFRALEAQEDAMHAAATATGLALVPRVVVLGRSQWNEGILLEPEHEWFVGAAVDTNLFAWGRDWARFAAARAREDQVSSQRAQAEGLLRLEVRQAHTNLEASRQRLEVAIAGQTAAEENLRVAQARYEQALNTSTDVLEARTRLDAARGNVAAASVDGILGLAALRRAVGLEPTVFPEELTPLQTP